MKKKKIWIWVIVIIVVLVGAYFMSDKVKSMIDPLLVKIGIKKDDDFVLPIVTSSTTVDDMNSVA